MLKKSILLGSLALVVALGAAAYIERGGATAQPPPAMQGPPPTYDYDPATPGTQPPASPLLAGFETRGLRSQQLAVTVLVPRAELQAILPPGFVAQGTMADPNAAAITLAFFYQQRVELPGVGTIGPASGLQVSANVLNTTTDPDRIEQLQLVHPLNDQPSVDALNAIYGPGSFRLAAVKVEIEEEEGTLRVTFEVQDAGLGLRVKASAEGPAAIVNRFRFDPSPVASRFLNGEASPNPPFRIAVQGDNRPIPIDEANLRFETQNGKLRLPGGDLTITGFDANVFFARWLEFFNKLE